MNPFNPEIALDRPRSPVAAILEKAADDETKALILGSGENGEASKIFTSSLIVGPLPIARPSPTLPKLELEKLHTYLFTAIETIEDAESGGAQILFKLRPELNFLQTTGLEDYWKKWSSVKLLQKRHSPEVGHFSLLISYFAPDDVLKDFDKLFYASLSNQSFEAFKAQYEQTEDSDIDEARNTVFDMYYRSHHVLKLLGYSMEVREDGVYFTLPDPRLLNYRLNALYEERPSLPQVKIGYYDDGISLMDYIKRLTIAPGCSDVLISTGKNFFSNMTFHLHQALVLTLEAEAQNKDSYRSGLAAFRKSVSDHYALINGVEDKIHKHRTASYRDFGENDPEFEKALWDKEIPQALSHAKLNLATLINLWFVDTNLEELNNMTKEKIENLLLGGFEFRKGLDYTSHFAKYKMTFDRNKIAVAWNTLSEFLTH